MLIDKQAPSSNENDYIGQSDHEILIVFRGHLFKIISPFSSSLREVLQAVTETHPSAENNFIRKTESNFLMVVCSNFPHLSHRSQSLHVKTHRQQ
jgi:ureidoglycolate hydrolase